jgi:hypothetical protein
MLLTHLLWYLQRDFDSKGTIGLIAEVSDGPELVV